MSQSPEEGVAPCLDKRRLVLEIAVLMAIFWLPSVWWGFHELLAGRRRLDMWPGQVAECLGDVGGIALVVYVLFRANESLPRFGLVRITTAHVGVILGLFVATAAIHILVLTSRWYFLLDFEWIRARMPPHPTRILPIPVLATVLPLSALKEEVFYRGYLATRLVDLWGSKWAAVLLSALCFSLIHIYQGWPGPLATLLVGVLYAVVFLSTRSIWPSVGAHVGYNLLVRLGVVTAVVSWILHRAAGV